MRLVRPCAELICWTPDPMPLLEEAGRTCYKSEDKITEDSADAFVRKIRKRGHLSVIEHASATVGFVVDRGVSHELVRHRLASYSQESTRYCSYAGGVTFVIPPWIKMEPGEYERECRLPRQAGETSLEYAGRLTWVRAMWKAESSYLYLLKTMEWSPQQARSVLPNSLKTEIVMTANFREWMHVFNLRRSSAAHPQMREVMEPLQKEFQTRWPAVFGPLEVSCATILKI